jgi:serine protease Do
MQLSPGCSGGALLNLDGEVVAVTTAVAGLTGLDAPGGFAVPVDARMRKIIEVLARGKEVEYGFLGVTFEPLKRDDQRGRGARIGATVPNGPAAKAGLQPNDLVVAINGNPVRDNDDLLLQIGSRTAGSEVRLEILRGIEIEGKKETVKKTANATLAKLYVAIRPLASNLRPDRFGVRVDYVSVLSQRSIGSTIPDGVVISQIVPGEPADKANLKPDQVIIAVNGIRVTTPDEFEKAAAQFEDRMQLTVINADRREETITLHAK